MTYWLSEPAEQLLCEPFCNESQARSDDRLINHVIVGSGYGACMTALVLALSRFEELKKSACSSDATIATAWADIAILERGKEYVPGEFPDRAAVMPGHVSIVKEGCRIGSNDALWDLRLGRGISSLTGVGLGGTSLVNANVALRPEHSLLQRLPDPPASQDRSSNKNWVALLEDYFALAEELLSVSPHPQARSFDKYKALEKVVKRIDTEIGFSVKPSPLMVNFESGSGIVDGQPACINCGNCITGCNTGAKNSLNLTILPILRLLGVRIFTGVEVLSLEKDDPTEPPGWKIHARLSSKPNANFRLAANNVVLSAGTIGSTEILARSKRDHGLAISPTLGSHFNTNGDSIGFGYGQSEIVNSVAEAGDYSSDSDKDVGIGPTIVGYAEIMVAADASTDSSKIGVADNERFLAMLQDGTIPFPLRFLWSEVLCTQDLLRRFGDAQLSAWHRKHKSHDPLLPSPDLDAHNQTLLLMGADDTTGMLACDGDTGLVVPKRNPRSNQFPFLEAADRCLSEIMKCSFLQGGFDGGKYLPNPLMRLIPDQFVKYFEGADDMPSHTLTVHPLGGCVIGESSETGVVNHYGQVFDNSDVERSRERLTVDKAALDTTSLHAGLYVCDGSILATPLAANPALTIAALGLHVGHSIVREKVSDIAELKRLARKSVAAAKGKYVLPANPKQQYTTATTGSTADDGESVVGFFEEHLFAELDPVKPHQPSNFERKPLDARAFLELLGLTEKVAERERQYQLEGLKEKPNSQDATRNTERGSHRNCLVLQIFVPELNVTDFLNKPEIQIPATAKLYLLKHSVVHRVRKEFVSDLEPLMEFVDGEVVLGKLYQPANWIQKQRRIGKAIRQVLHYRRAEIWTSLKDMLSGRRSRVGSVWNLIKTIWRIAGLHTDWRRIEYRFSTTDPDTGDTLTMLADKEFAYAPGKQDLWNALGWLRPKVVRQYLDERPEEFAELYFEVDVVSISRGPSPLQIFQTPDLPTTVFTMLMVGGYFMRVVLQTHFWSLGAASYSKYKSSRELRRWRMQNPPRAIHYKIPNGRQMSAAVRQSAVYEPKEHKARLVRYQPDRAHVGAGVPRESVLLVHGLGHGSRVFWTDTIAGSERENKNFVQVMLSRGYDVWLLDYRTSSSLIRDVDPKDAWDDIAKIDIPWAVNYIYDKINANPYKSVNPAKIHLFAHCIGAGAVSMAILSGLLNRQGGSMLASFAMHAVPPWLHASAENRIRANFYSLVKDWPLFSRLDPIPNSKPNFLETLLDRLASIYQWSPDEWKGVSDKDRGSEFARKVFNRYRFIWGHEWNSDNVDARTKSEFAKLIGPVPVTILKQVYFSVFRSRLTDAQGTNKYVKAENFEKHWNFPTLLVHGDQNRVFDVECTKLSAELLTRLQLIKTDGNELHMTRMTIDDAEAFRRKSCCNNSAHVGQRVWLKILAGYGHMDVLFGKQAAQDVHSYVGEFFKQARVNAADPNVRTNEDYPRNIRRHIGENLREQEIRNKRPLLVGPIISHLEDNEICMWAESNDFVTQSPVQFGVVDKDDIAVQLTDDGVQHSEIEESDVRDRSNFWLTYFPLSRKSASELKFPLTAVVRYANDTQSGDNEISSELRSLHKAVPGFRWNDMPWYKKHMNQSDGCADKISLLLGSCLHPGTSFERRKSDQVFKGLSIQAGLLANRQGKFIADGADALVLLGDTIYADATASLFDPHSYYERFRVRYRTAFGGKYAKHLMANLPTHFVIDDHEIINNWQGVDDPSKTIRTGFERQSHEYQFDTAVDEAWHFLRRPKHGWRRSGDQKPPLWDEFQVSGFPFFSFDTRTERSSESSRMDVEALMGKTQIEHFTDWLEQRKVQQSKVIFLASGSPLLKASEDLMRFPAVSAWTDELIGYPGFVLEITRLLADYQNHMLNSGNGRPTIVWLSGDLHLSFDSLVRLVPKGNDQNGGVRRTDAPVMIRHICASGLHIPIPFGNNDGAVFDQCPGAGDLDDRSVFFETDERNRQNHQSDFDKTMRRIDLGVLEIGFKSRLLSDHQQHFVRLDCNYSQNNGLQPAIEVRAFNEFGEDISYVHRCQYCESAMNQYDRTGNPECTHV